MNCSQALHEPAPPAQALLEKVFVLSWSEYASMNDPVPLTGPISLVTLITLSKSPNAVDMWP